MIEDVSYVSIFVNRFPDMAQSIYCGHFWSSHQSSGLVSCYHVSLGFLLSTCNLGWHCNSTNITSFMLNSLYIIPHNVYEIYYFWIGQEVLSTF